MMRIEEGGFFSKKWGRVWIGRKKKILSVWCGILFGAPGTSLRETMA